GVLFGSRAKVDVAGLVATTADISNDAFMHKDVLHFDKVGRADAAIINEGTITAREAGLVGLVAPYVLNSGTITAKLGNVQLASGDSAAIDMYGDGLVQIAVSDKVKNQLVANSGSISADGGSITMSAAAGKEIVNSLIAQTGALQARSVAQRQGNAAEGSNAVVGNEAAHKGKKSGVSTVINAGVLDVSGRNAGERGGTLRITGDKIALDDGTRIDASGHSGKAGTIRGKEVSAMREGAAGGDIRIGGDYLGQGTTPTAKQLYVDKGALILNDALHTGDAGRSIFWADDSTHFYGNVYARALGGKPIDATTWQATLGGNAGDGGFVETSGKRTLDALGYVDLTASSGERGTYLLDPADITIYGHVDPAFQSTDGTINLSTNLKLWLDGDDTNANGIAFASDATEVAGSLNTWVDKSGSGNNAIGYSTRPTRGGDTLNGRNVVSFSGATGGFYIPYNANMNSANSFVSVMINLRSKTAGMYVSPIFSRDTGPGPTWNPYMGYNFYADNNNEWEAWHGGGGTNWNRIGSNAVVLNQTEMLSQLFSAAGKTFYQNGASQGSSTNPMTPQTDEDLYIGNSGGSIEPINGFIPEMLIYNTNLSTDARNLVEQYQSAKWGIALTPPGTGADEVTRATAADGYSVFTTRYLERLSQSANVSLVATNNITLDLKGDNLNFSTSGRSLTMNAGNAISTASAGSITTNNGAISLTAGTGGINVAHAFSLNSGTAATTLTSSNSPISFSGSLTLGGNTTLNAGSGTISAASTIASGSNNLTLTSDDVVLGGNVSGTGALTLQQSSNNPIVRINSGAGDYNLSTAELGRLVDGWNSITIGNLASGNDIFIGTSTWQDPVIFRNNAGKIFNGFTGTGNASLTTQGGWTSVNGDITTANQPITLGDLDIDGATTRTISSNGGNISIGGMDNNSLDTNLTVNSSGGNITITQPINLHGDGSSGQTITLNAGSGTITTSSTINSGGNNLHFTSDDLVLSNTIAGTATLTMQPSSTNRTLRVNSGAGDYNLSTTELGRIMDGWSGIVLGNPATSVTSYLGDSTWNDPLTFRSGNAAVKTYNITGAGNASLTFTGNTAWVDMLGSMTTSGQPVNLAGFDYILSLSGNNSITTNGGTVSIDDLFTKASFGDLSINTSGGAMTIANLDAGTGSFSAGRSLSLNAGTGNITLTNAQSGGQLDLSVTAQNISLGSGLGNLSPYDNLSLTSTNALSLPAISASSILARATAGNLTLGGNI
ncbi:MAG: hypothetical protein EAY65_00155, partial [Alphaproteobacteria bacterium]